MGIGQFFKGKVTILLVLSVVAWAFGIFQGYYGTQYVIFPADVKFLLFTICVFAFSFLFFGFLSPVILFFVGTHTGKIFSLANVISPKIIILSFSAFAAAYAAIRLGDALLDDMIGTGNFNRAAKISMISVFVALAVAALWDLGLVV